ncbi:MAG TPA: toll/interleukin-1 receptor domain-containing protein [Abditibacteriaceae bacterium]
MNHDVFISYATENQDVADKACDFLENNGVRCWIATRDIHIGQDYDGKIVEAISACKVLLLLFASHSNESDDVKTELALAASKRKAIVPLRIEGATPSASMEYRLIRCQWLSALDGLTETNLQRLIAAVKRYLPEQVNAATSIDAPEPQITRLESAPPVQKVSEESKNVVMDTVPDEAPDVEPNAELIEAAPEKFDYTRKINRGDFLAACNEEDREYFTQILDYCQSNPRKITIEWGSKGFSLKDRNERPLIWMFPTRGTQWTIQTRTQRYTKREKEQVSELLSAEGIKGISWRPNDLPLEKTKAIINLLCRIKTD